jgi:hypothetical protein
MTLYMHKTSAKELAKPIHITEQPSNELLPLQTLVFWLLFKCQKKNASVRGNKNFFLTDYFAHCYKVKWNQMRK